MTFYNTEMLKNYFNVTCSWESKDLLTSDFNHSKIPTSKFHYVEIKKSSKGFGFTISGGREYGDVPLSILKITEGSPADQDGNLKVC